MKNPGPYCGLLCMFALTQILEKPCDLEDLVKPEYMTSVAGSSIAELAKAARDCGLSSLAVEKMTTRLLRRMSCPVILHVRKPATLQPYNHWVLFLGVQNNQALLYDPPASLEQTPFHVLAARWDGTGLCVSNPPIDSKPILELVRKRFFVLALAAILAIAVLHFGGRYWARLFPGQVSRSRYAILSVAQSGLLVVLSFVLGVAGHYFGDEGILAHPHHLATLISASPLGLFEEIEFERARELHGDLGIVFIDARESTDFDHGHVEGAVNVPIGLDQVTRLTRLKRVSRNACIVVYCQSSGCPYGRILARLLFLDGFSNVCLYRGGWDEWQRRQTSDARGSTERSSASVALTARD